MNARDQLARKGHTIAQRKDEGGTLHCTKCKLVFTDSVGTAASYQVGRPGYDLLTCDYAKASAPTAVADDADDADDAVRAPQVPLELAPPLAAPVRRGPGRPRRSTTGG